MHKTWKRIPSVTTGGKAYFYTRYLNDGRQLIVVWDRVLLAYLARIEIPGQPLYKTIDACTTALQAKRSIDRAVADGTV